MSIAVVDDGGYLLYFVRMSEQIAPASAHVAVEKARSAALFKRATLSWEEAAKERPVIMTIPNVLPLGFAFPYRQRRWRRRHRRLGRKFDQG